MGTVKKVTKKALGDMGFNSGGGVINWFPGHMAAATRAIRDRLKLADLVIEVRDSRVRTSISQLVPLLLLFSAGLTHNNGFLVKTDSAFFGTRRPAATTLSETASDCSK